MVNFVHNLTGLLHDVEVYQCGSAASMTKLGLTHGKFVHVQTFSVGSQHCVCSVGACKVQKIGPCITILDSAPHLALPCWTLIWG